MAADITQSHKVLRCPCIMYYHALRISLDVPWESIMAISAYYRSGTRAGPTGVCENNDGRHKEPYIAMCVPTRKMPYEMHIVIYRSL